MSRAIKIMGEIQAPDALDADALLDELIVFLAARHCTFCGSADDAEPITCSGGHEHFHCELCGGRYDTSQEAEACFDGHAKEEHLEWAAREAGYLASSAKSLFERIGAINAKYGLT